MFNTTLAYFFNLNFYKMFNCKLDSLFEKTSTSNGFVNAALQKSAETLTQNGAKTYSTTGDPFVDQFGSISKYRELRDFSLICSDCEKLWAVDKLQTVKFIFFLRMITRKIDYIHDGEVNKTELSQKGAEMRYEGIMRLIWLHIKSPEIFWKNAYLIPFIGSWKDIFLMLRYDLIYNGWDKRVLDWNRFEELIHFGLSKDSTRELVKKYLPQVKARSKCKTIEAQANCIIAKWLATGLFGSTKNLNYEDKYNVYRRYARLKSSGTAHEWQQLISKGKYDLIRFETIHGKALTILARSKFFDNHNLREKFTEWITADSTDNVKSTEFVHELFAPYPNTTFFRRNLSEVPKDQQALVNKKFYTLVNKAKDQEIKTKFIVVRDTSSSMIAHAIGTKVSSYDIGKALALYFSEFLTGPFSNCFMEFANDCRLCKWYGNTPIEKWFNDHSEAYGSTNFQSVIDLFIKIKKQGVAESDFPTGIICISDGELDPVSLNASNIEAARRKLFWAGFSEEFVDNFVIVMWNITNDYYDEHSRVNFDTYGNVKNTFYFGGYSASVLTFLFTGELKTTTDLYKAAMNQEILNLVQI